MYISTSRETGSNTVRRRPPLGDGANTGISGPSAAHNSLLILRPDMLSGYGLQPHVPVVLATLRPLPETIFHRCLTGRFFHSTGTSQVVRSHVCVDVAERLRQLMPGVPPATPRFSRFK
ncbi:hypothetical protein F3J19_06020 [Burkholderia sp. Ax-1724]|nr:hypothetical protein [Burkholderia sp. Ax-1724]